MTVGFHSDGDIAGLHWLGGGAATASHPPHLLVQVKRVHQQERLDRVGTQCLAVCRASLIAQCGFHVDGRLIAAAQSPPVKSMGKMPRLRHGPGQLLVAVANHGVKVERRASVLATGGAEQECAHPYAAGLAESGTRHCAVRAAAATVLGKQQGSHTKGVEQRVNHHDTPLVAVTGRILYVRVLRGTFSLSFFDALMHCLSRDCAKCAADRCEPVDVHCGGELEGLQLKDVLRRLGGVLEGRHEAPRKQIHVCDEAVDVLEAQCVVLAASASVQKPSSDPRRSLCKGRHVWRGADQREDAVDTASALRTLGRVDDALDAEGVQLAR